MATKLNEDDLVVSVSLTDAKIEKYSKFTLEGEIVEEDSIESNLNVVLATKGGIFLKFPLTEVPEKKKNAIGVRGIKLVKDDTVLDVYLYGDGDDVTVDYKKKTVDLSKMKMAHRDTKGTKVKL